MGLEDFAKGNKDSNDSSKDTQLAQNIESLLASANVENPRAEVEGSKVKVFGQVATVDAKNKAIEMVKTQEGVVVLTDRLEVTGGGSANVDTNSDGRTVYTVQYGDTLWGISEKFLGDGSKYMQIFEENKHLWKDHNNDPNVLYPDWKLTIPNS